LTKEGRAVEERREGNCGEGREEEGRDSTRLPHLRGEKSSLLLRGRKGVEAFILHGRKERGLICII
jgi:hypothetical protein